jgi:hypothetical protein
VNPRPVRLAWLCFALLATHATLALAQKRATLEPPPERRRIVGILEVRLDGVPAQIAAQFESNLEKQLDRQTFWLAPRARLHEMLANSTHWSDGCVVGPCLKELRTQTGADLVLLAEINGSGTTFGYAVTVVRTDNGQVLSQAADQCEVCTVNEALSSATSAAVTLVTAVPEKLPDDSADRDAAINRLTSSRDALAAAHARNRRRLSEVIAVSGLALGTAGFAIYFLGNRSEFGLATGSAGAGLALGAAVSLAF